MHQQYIFLELYISIYFQIIYQVPLDVVLCLFALKKKERKKIQCFSCLITSVPTDKKCFLYQNSATAELANIDWDNIGFAVMPTDYMYSMKCSQDGNFSKGELQRFGNIELSPASGILNYGQVCFATCWCFLY